MVYGNAKIYGNAKVFYNANVFGDAKVYDNAKVFDYAKVCGNAMINSNIFSANRSDGYTFIIFRVTDNSLRIIAGCRFFTIEEAINHWTTTRGGTKLGNESIMIVNHLVNMMNL
jgi:hypothetical protein